MYKQLILYLLKLHKLDKMSFSIINLNLLEIDLTRVVLKFYVIKVIDIVPTSPRGNYSESKEYNYNL